MLVIVTQPLYVSQHACHSFVACVTGTF